MIGAADRNDTLMVLGSAGGLVAIDKPPGLLVIPGRSADDQRCARDLHATQLGAKVWVCHRIDRDTSGVVVFATTAAAHGSASVAFEAGEAKKKYVALVEGVIDAPMVIDLPLTEGRKGKMRAVFASEEGKPARTRVKPLQQFSSSATLIECEPETGRQHQIRVHLKAKGHPLLFDHQYGSTQPVFGLERTPLHAARLDLLGHVFEAPIPDDLRAVMNALSGLPLPHMS